MDKRIASIVVSLRDRMRFYKLDVIKNAAAGCIRFNSKSEPELLDEENDPYRIQWVTTPPTNETVVGERVRVFRLYMDSS
jgi:actin-related protein 8